MLAFCGMFSVMMLTFIWLKLVDIDKSIKALHIAGKGML